MFAWMGMAALCWLVLAEEAQLTSIDIVVPSYFPTVAGIERMLTLNVPPLTNVSWYITLDKRDDGLRLPDTFLRRWASNKQINFIYCTTHRGAAGTRNVGFEAGQGDWVIFIDDDVVPDPDLISGYLKVIRAAGDNPPTAIAGVVTFPKPETSFNTALKGLGMIQNFDRAATKESLAWGVTANFCVNRKLLGSIRFIETFPKGGGGEDLAIGYQIVRASGRRISCAPHALAVHPWWPNRSYTRFFRWGYGDSLLYSIFPEYSALRPPNFVELVLYVVVFLLIPTLFVGGTRQVLPLLLSLAVASFCDHWIVQSLREGIWSPVHALEVLVIQTSYELGTVAGILRNLKLSSLSQGMSGHWDYDDKTVSHVCVYLVLVLQLGLFFSRGSTDTMKKTR